MTDWIPAFAGMTKSHSPQREGFQAKGTKATRNRNWDFLQASDADW